MGHPRLRLAAAVLAGWTGAVTARAAEPAPPRVEGNNPAIDGSFLRPYTNAWTFAMQKPGGPAVEAGVWTDRLERTTHAGRPALKRTQVAEYKNGIRLTFVNVFDAKTMASLTFDYARSDTGEKRRLEFAGRKATFRRLPGTGSEPEQDYVATVAHDVLDFHDGLYGILLDAFPLREDYAAEFPAFDTDRACVDWVTMKVTGRERIAAGPGREADSWVVSVQTRLYGSSTWWLTRDAPYVIKAVLVLPASEGGVTITYTMTG
jgi:hypothetical protein